ncbi:MAG: type II secretion system protein GspD, partial [Rhodoferax sp.]|nr:type II secretion system protein GspD [Rhodoferax sp.]
MNTNSTPSRALFKRLPIATYLIAVCAIWTGATGTFSIQAQAQTQTPTTTPKRGEAITLNFNNAEIEAVARTLAAVTGRNVVVDPRVKGTITLSTDAPVAPAVAYNQFLATLRMQGYTVVSSDGMDKVVPEADAKLQGGAVSESIGANTASGNQLVTQIIRLQHENANNLVAVLRPLVNPNSPINVNPGTNTLVITDYADNLRRLVRIIAALDVPNATDVEIIALKHASASDLAPLVQKLAEPNAASGAPAADGSYKTTIIAEPRSNTLIVRAANQARLALVKSLVDKLDQPSPSTANGAAGNIYVVYLKNASAVQLASTLRAAISGEARNAPSVGSTPVTSTAGGANASAQTSSSFGSSANANAATTGGQIQADPATNSLIITASEPQYRQLRAVIDKLDARRAQVYVESLIAEVNE